MNDHCRTPIVCVSTDQVVTISLSQSACAGPTSQFIGVYYTARGEQRDCEHRHGSEDEALACGMEMLRAYIARRHAAMRTARRRQRYRHGR